MKNRFKKIDYVLILAAVFCLVLALCPYTMYKSMGNRLASDGNLERFTPSFVSVLRIVFAAAFVLCSGIVLWQLCDGAGRSRFFRSLVLLPGRCVRDAGPFFRDLRAAFHPRGQAFWWFLLVFAGGILVRLLQLSAPLLHDEAYSMAMWARSDLLFSISDYHLPNNHVFHSFLINLVYHTLGKTPALLRLPVFLSGCLLIPAVWLLAKLFTAPQVVGHSCQGL